MSKPKTTIEYPVMVSNFLAGKLLAKLKLSSDDKCPACGYIYPFTLYSSGEREYLPGSHPYCKGQWQDHMTRRVEARIKGIEYKLNTYAQGISTVVFIAKDGSVSVPPSPDTPCPPGYSRKDITSYAEAQAFTKDMRLKAKEQYELFHQAEESRWNNYYASLGKELRDGTTVPVAQYDNSGNVVGYEHRRVRPLHEMPKEMQDLAREAEKQFGQYSGYNPNQDFMVGIQAVDFDESSIRRFYD